MRTVTQEELNKILENHMHWIREDCEGWENMRADLSNTDLHNVDILGANLYCANLYGANLSCTHLCETNLYEANLRDADLRGADLHFADLQGADLQGANLRDANLCDANLSSTNLYDACLRGANLRHANLHEANLLKTEIHEADLRGADLSEAKNVPFIPLVCPDVKAFTGWKKAFVLNDTSLDVPFDVIIELEIPADARRSSATTRKCRCDKAVVRSITSIDGTESFDAAFSKYDYNFIYRVGETVYVDKFEEDRFKECAEGIHFFVNRQEAVDY